MFYKTLTNALKPPSTTAMRRRDVIARQTFQRAFLNRTNTDSVKVTFDFRLILAVNNLDVLTLSEGG